MTTAQFSKARNLADLIKDYEAVARHNRPDWDQFVAEAKAEPYDITWEVIDHHDDFAGTIAPGLCEDDALDMAYDAVTEWLNTL